VIRIGGGGRIVDCCGRHCVDMIVISEVEITDELNSCMLDIYSLEMEMVGDISQLSQMMPFRLFRLLKVIDA
jgi:hypothetical protein